MLHILFPAILMLLVLFNTVFFICFMKRNLNSSKQLKKGTHYIAKLIVVLNCLFLLTIIYFLIYSFMSHINQSQLAIYTIYASALTAYSLTQTIYECMYFFFGFVFMMVEVQSNVKARTP